MNKERDIILKEFQYTCVNPKSEQELLCIVANSRVIPYRRFMKNVEKEFFVEFEKEYGSLKGEQYVSFYKSITPLGKEVYYFQHSAIEYIFY